MKQIDKSDIIRDKIAKSQTSPLKVYRELTVGQTGFLKFLYYEIVTFCFGPMPGGLGFFLRKKFYPRLFKKVGRGFILGRNVVVRHPQNIVIGDFVTIDDNCLIDGRGAGENGLVFEDQVIINRNCMIQAKTGFIKIGKRTSVGSNSVIVSMSGVEIGEALLTAGNCYISAGVYAFDDLKTPIMDQMAYSKGPIKIGKNSWFGTGVTVLDGVNIGEGAVIGASSVVNKNIPDFAIAFGVPAKVYKIRGEKIEQD
jgi:acetyltransferase-like isoleucine patch superfamily enzyme